MNIYWEPLSTQTEKIPTQIGVHKIKIRVYGCEVIGDGKLKFESDFYLVSFRVLGNHTIYIPTGYDLHSNIMEVLYVCLRVQFRCGLIIIWIQSVCGLF